MTKEQIIAIMASNILNALIMKNPTGYITALMHRQAISEATYLYSQVV